MEYGVNAGISPWHIRKYLGTDGICGKRKLRSANSIWQLGNSMFDTLDKC